MLSPIFRTGFRASSLVRAFSISKTNFRSVMESGPTPGIDLNIVVRVLKDFASPSLAGSWDNVGLLLQPANPALVKTILLTIDLTEDVMEEALSVEADFIISYHPPIFAPLKKITKETWKERIIAQCLANNIAIYSPHTSWDIVEGGLTDWLASAFDCKEVKPLITQKTDVLGSTFILTVETLNNDLFQKIIIKNKSLESQFKILSKEQSESDSGKTKFVVECTDEALGALAPILTKDTSVSYYYVNQQHKIDDKEVSGIGRMCKLKNPITIYNAVELLKKHLQTPYVQLALARKKMSTDLVETVACVAGSGGSLMKKVFCDLKVTGEASHHEILDSVHSGSSVIVTNHSNSERGFLRKFKKLLTEKLKNPEVHIMIAESDTDPLQVF